ncbi:MAG: hypothetical protein LBU15_00895 [Rickettsiales bacterium]|jgi:hypothetical protein|nr:hypothetical protein [Rickettsiales bacterium]
MVSREEITDRLRRLFEDEAPKGDASTRQENGGSGGQNGGQSGSSVVESEARGNGSSARVPGNPPEQVPSRGSEEKKLGFFARLFRRKR